MDDPRNIVLRKFLKITNCISFKIKTSREAMGARRNFLMREGASRKRLPHHWTWAKKIKVAKRSPHA